MTAVAQLIGIGIKNALAGNANLTALVGGRIFDTQPDAGELNDFVVFNHFTGGDENTSAIRSIDCQFLIKAESYNHDNAELLAGYIDDAIGNLSVSGWVVWGLTMGNLVSYTEDINGTPFYHRGWLVRIRIEQ